MRKKGKDGRLKSKGRRIGGVRGESEGTGGRGEERGGQEVRIC